MITRLSGKLVRVGIAEAYFEVPPFEYEVMVPDVVRRQLGEMVGEDVSLQIVDYIDGNVQKGGRMTPRMVGFLSPIEKEFFELFCSVDGLGVKKALAAMNRPVADIAAAIEDRNDRMLTTLPGIGPAVADRVIAKLSRKMAKFALLIQQEIGERPPVKRDIANETHDALVSLGHSPGDAAELVKQAAENLGKKAKTVQDLLNEVFRLQRA